MLSLVPVVSRARCRCPGLWQAAGPPMEEGFMLVFPERVLEGDLPNRDFLHLYGPAAVGAGRASSRCSDVASRAERAVGYLQQLGVVFGVFAAAAAVGPVGGGHRRRDRRRRDHPADRARRPWRGSGPSPSACGDPGRRRGLEEADGRPPATACSGRPASSAGAALLYRPDLIVAMGASLGVVLWHLDGRDRRRLVRRARCVGVAPYLVHLAMAGPGNVVAGHGDRAGVRAARRSRASRCRRRDDFDGFLQRAGAARRAAVAVPGASPARCSSASGSSCSSPPAVLLLVAGRALRRATAGRACSSWPCSPPGSSPRRCSGPTPPTWPG